MAPTNSSMLTISCQPHYRQWWRWEDFPLCEVGRHSQRPLWISSPIWMFGEDLGCPWERRKCWQLDSRSNEDPKPSWINSLHLTFLGVLHQCTGGNSTLIEIMWFQVPWLVPAIGYWIKSEKTCVVLWLVVEPYPSEKWLRQFGSWNSQNMEK